MTGLTPLLCQPESSPRGSAQRQEGAATQPRDRLAGTGNPRRVFRASPKPQSNSREGGGKEKSEGDAESKGSDSFLQR